MKSKTIWAVVAAAMMALAAGAYEAGMPTAPNGVALVRGYREWQAIAPSFRPDKDHIRIILGNEAAVRACRSGVRPFPDGAVFAKIAWKTRRHPESPEAVIPGSFAQVEFMIKDAGKYKETAGWGFARFVGPELRPYGRDPGFARECLACHEPMAGNDFVFTSLAEVP